MSDRDRREDEISMQINKILSLTKGSALDQAGLSQFDHCPAEEATTKYPRILYEWTFIELYLCRVIESEPGIVHFEQARIERGDPSLMRFERTREPMGAANELIHLNERWMRSVEAEARLRDALEEIAHDHGWQAVALERESASLAIGFAQGIAREALGEPQNEWTEEAMRLREQAKQRCELRGEGAA